MMTKLNGKELWDFIEKKAQKKYGKDESWKLVDVNLLDDEIAKVTLMNGKEKLKGMVVYQTVL
ncbi:MAG: hypothetical protein H0Z24_03410 [Thermosipho sp. (in: Bacteria)]|nr:hypothetical protein [Thermosipho sp. (in: thermotogales)]